MFILTIKGFSNLPGSKYFNKNLNTLVKNKEAQVIEVGKRMKIGKDNLYINRIINTSDKTYIRYSFIRLEQGWSFPEGALMVFDDIGNVYYYVGLESFGKIWGQEGLIAIDRINKNSKHITIKFDWYDRKNELTISLGKEGEIIEN